MSTHRENYRVRVAAIWRRQLKRSLIGMLPSAILWNQVSSNGRVLAPSWLSHWCTIGESAHHLRLIFGAPDVATARKFLEQALAAYEVEAPQAMQRFEASFTDAVAVLTLLEPYRQRLRSRSGFERLNAESRRRERVIRLFPNEEAGLANR